MQDRDSDELLRRVAGGDAAALAELYDRHAGWLLLRLQRRCSDPGLAEEVLQDVFLSVWRSAGRYRPGSAGGWLWTVASRRLVEGLRRAGGGPAQQEWSERPTAGLEDVVLSELAYGDLGTALAGLSPELRSVLQGDGARWADDAGGGGPARHPAGNGQDAGSPSSGSAASGTGMSAWHVTLESAGAYAAGRLGEPQAWSLETHLEQCDACARLVSSTAEPGALARVRARVLEQAHPPARGFVRLTVTPALGAAWLVAVAGVVAGVLVLDLLDATRLPVLLLVAPLLPLLGLALGCAPRADGGAELLASTPVSTLQVLLLRAGAVLVVSVPPLLGVSLVTGTGPLSWLAPSAGLVGLALALTTRLRVEVATGCAAGVWALAALGPAALQEAPPLGLAPGAAAAWVVLAVVCFVLLAVRREHLDVTGALR